MRHTRQLHGTTHEPLPRSYTCPADLAAQRTLSSRFLNASLISPFSAPSFSRIWQQRQTWRSAPSLRPGAGLRQGSGGSQAAQGNKRHIANTMCSAARLGTLGYGASGSRVIALTAHH